jgi:uncharacterized membrane protein YdjX (TVP38/TMEM64 family)
MNLLKFDKASIVKLMFLVLFLAALTVFGIKTAPWFIEHAKNPVYMREYLSGFGNAGFLVYILIQAVQAIVLVFPGDLFSICGGFVYGIPLGFFLSFIGLMIGTVIVFYISRFFGYNLISNFISKEKIEKMSAILNSTKGTIGMFVIFIIPFFPKDILIYIAGLTPVKAPRLFITYGLSRIPGLLVWVSVGANTYEKDFLGLAITIVVLLIMLGVAWFISKNYRGKIKSIQPLD